MADEGSPMLNQPPPVQVQAAQIERDATRYAADRTFWASIFTAGVSALAVIIGAILTYVASISATNAGKAETNAGNAATIAKNAAKSAVVAADQVSRFDRPLVLLRLEGEANVRSNEQGHFEAPFVAEGDGWDAKNHSYNVTEDGVYQVAVSVQIKSAEITSRQIQLERTRPGQDPAFYLLAVRGNAAGAEGASIETISGMCVVKAQNNDQLKVVLIAEPGPGDIKIIPNPATTFASITQLARSR